MRSSVTLSFLAVIMLASCSTTYGLDIKPYDPSADRQMLKSDYVQATLKNGQTFVMEPPRDYGTAWCGEYGCASKDAITMVATREEKVDAGSAALLPIAIPACLVGLCGPINGTPGRADPVAATAERVSRLWLDFGYAEGNRIYYRSGEVNWCQIGSRLFAAQKFLTDDQALDFVWRNRTSISGVCLSDAGRIFVRRGDQLKGRSLWATGEIRRIWDDALCAPGPASHVRVPQWLDSGPRKGDPVVLGLLREAASDPSTYYVERDAESPCQMPATSSEREQRRARIMAEASAFAIEPIRY